MRTSVSGALDLHPIATLYVLDRLRQAGRITLREIQHYLRDMRREIHALEQRISHLRHLASSDRRHVEASAARPRTEQRPDASGAPPARTPHASPRKKHRRKFTVTAAVLKSREIQGRYLPLLNKMPKGKRPYYAKVAKERGREAAIREMEAALG